jgi:two-component system OmpR family response regulator
MATQARILIVDDEAGIRFSLEETLARDGYQVATAENGEAALACVAAQPTDLVLIDLRLPGMSGMEVLAALRQQSPDTVVIVLTAHASLETAVEALRQGAHDYLFKPCKTVELRESVRRGLLSRRQKLQQRELLQQLEQHLSSSLQNLRATLTEPPAAADAPRPVVGEVAAPADAGPAEEGGRFLQQGELIVDLTRHVITLAGQLLELSPTEFNLLAYLASEAPRVVSPQELVREVQGYQSETWEASETVRYHVYRLRQKIKEATRHADIIRTVRGVGYTISK